MTNASGDAEFSLLKEGIYYAIAKDVFSDATKQIFAVSSETLQGQTITLRLKNKNGKDDFDQKLVDITVFGKDLDGTVKPLRGAVVYFGDGSKTTDYGGLVSFQHNYKLGTYVAFVCSADGYKTQESAFIVGSKPMINDNGEITLVKNPLTTIPLQVQVLNKKDDSPINNATVSINLRTPQNVNGQNKSIWGVQYSDNNGMADWTGKSGQPIDADLPGKSELFVNASKDGFKDSKYVNIPTDLLAPSTETRMFTIWLEPKEDLSGLVSESLEVPNTKPDKIFTKDILSDGVMYLIEASGTVSDWDTKNPDGVDPCYCYIKWRCPNPEPWGQLVIDGKNMHTINGSTIPYNSGHSYSVLYKGTGNKMELYCSDALGSSGDNSGKFKVKITRQ